MTFTLNWRTALGWVIGGVVGWLVRHLLDKYRLFEELTLHVNDSGVGDWFKGLFESKYSLFDIAVFLLFAALGYWTMMKVIRKFIGPEAKRLMAKKELLKFRSLVFEERFLRFTWEIEFNKWDKPEVVNLRPYCLWHDPPIPMTYDRPLQRYRCQQDCRNTLTKPALTTGSTYDNEFASFKAQIQAHLEKMWEDLNKKQ